MPKRIVNGLASVVRHAGWWLEWRIRPEPGSGSRALDDSGLGREAQQCASSS